MSVDYESPNPIAHLVHEALQKGTPVLHAIRSLAAAVDGKGNSLFEKDRLGDRDPVMILERIMAEHPELDEGLDALYDIANHGKVNQEPGRQPNLEYYVGCLRNGVNEPRPMVNVGCGPNPPDIAGVVNYDPFHKTPPKKKGLYVSNAYTDRPDDVLEVKYAPKGTWLSQDGYESVESDPDIAKCSRGVIQSFEPEKLPAGDRVDIVPNYRIWSENGMAVPVGEGTYHIPELHTVGLVAGGKEYDHSAQADAVLEVGWHLVLFSFYARVLRLVKHVQGAAIPKKMQDFPHLTSPGDDEKVGRVSEWMEKLNGQLIHLAVLRDGTAYEFTRGKTTGTQYRHSCPVDGHLLFERVTRLVDGVNVVTDYLVAGQWNNIKIPQKPSVIGAFCDKIQISGLGGDVVKPRPAYDQWEDGMEGLIGYIPTEWKSFYYKARKFVDVDIDVGTLRSLPKLFAKHSLYLTQTDLSRRDPRAIYQVTLVEDKSVLEGRNGCDETIYTKAFRAEIGELRSDKKRPDPEGKIMNLVLQLRAEEIADRLNEEDL